MTAYYNENDPFAAAWLRELIKAGHIAPGVVDERSIVDVLPDELSKFTQCHFFAGVGVWSYALRLAGWPDSRPVWTGSCPCQPFSISGKGGGFDDERHLWPSWFHLIQHGKRSEIPVFGEQVASQDGLYWLDLVSADMEGAGNALWAVDLCAAGVGAAHRRQRLYFLALLEGLGHADSSRAKAWLSEQAQRQKRHSKINDDGSDRLFRSSARRSDIIGMADMPLIGRDGGPGLHDREQAGQRREIIADNGLSIEAANAQHNDQRPDQSGRPVPINGFWRDADWLSCRDGKWRPVESGTFPLVDGAPARVGRLRGYGNAINAYQATTFIEVAMEVIQ